MRRAVTALSFGAFLTILPWILRPLFGDRTAILWLLGFVAVSHWFPLGLHAREAGSAKVFGCLANILIWAVMFLLLSYARNLKIKRLSS